MSILHRTWIALPLLAACSSQGEKPDSPLNDARERMKIEAYTSKAMQQQTTLGMYLAQLDRSIQLWNQVFLNGDKIADRQRLASLHANIAHRTEKLFFEILTELDSGPPINRRIAAAALGFADDERALSPLLNALGDSDQEVVANALLGLAMLGDLRTPTESLAHCIEYGETSVIRNNAALATLEILRSGGKGGEEVVEAARLGLHDDDPGVRTQSALILAQQLDSVSIPDLSMQMAEDPIPSAAMSAARAVAYIGSREIRHKGRVARAMTAALSKVDGRVRESLLHDLRRLAGRNYAEEEDWVTWAHKLPLEPL